jgi:hypothetical protein
MLEDINHFTGTDKYYKHFLGILFTDGIKYVADEAGAYWLIDAIASYQPRLRQEEFQSWTLKKNENDSWTLSATDGNDRELVRQEIEFSDFPRDKMNFFLCNKTLMLPSEY